MCDNKTHTPRRGSALEHGRAHEEDHQLWTRRDFLVGLSAASAGTVMIGSTPITSFGRSSVLERLRAIETDRVLVLVQLAGGNDGLNTVVPVDNDDYHNARPGIRIEKAEAEIISPGVGLHPELANLRPLYSDGDLAIVHSVGYPTPVLSHFRSTDIWVTGSDSEEVLTTGWAGRYLDGEYPDFETTPTEHPVAVQIGGVSAMMFQGPSANLGMTVSNLATFERIAEDGTVFDASDVPDTPFGDEIAYVRTVANESFAYAEAIHAASQSGTNEATYEDNSFAEDLAIVARLISGNLGSRIYTVSLGGFDTHSGQAGRHATLMQRLANGLKAFQDDLAAQGLSDRVLTMTLSEFGRRVNQNGSSGTDHGTAAPLMIMGTGVNGGLYGELPDLQNLDGNGNLIFQTDFRAIYATTLRDWFGLSASDTDAIFGGTFPNLGFVTDPTTVGVRQGDEESDAGPHILLQNFPNPFNAQTTISYVINETSHVHLEVFDATGRRVRLLVDGVQTAGTHAEPFDADRLPGGVYFYQVRTRSGAAHGQMVKL